MTPKLTPRRDPDGNTRRAQTRPLTQLFISWRSNLLLWPPQPEEKQGVPGRGRLLYGRELGVQNKGWREQPRVVSMRFSPSQQPQIYRVFCTIATNLTKQEIVKFLLTLEEFILSPVLPSGAPLDSGWPREDIPLTDKGTELWVWSSHMLGLDPIF